MPVTTFRDNPTYGGKTATIANGQTVSGVVDLQGQTLVGFQTPAALTGVAFTFQVSVDGSTYTVLKDGAGGNISYTVAASNYIPVDSTKFLGVRYLKIVSGSAEGAERVIILATRNVK